MTQSWQETYYMFATFGALAGVASCLISLALFMRTRPDRLKARVEEAVGPLTSRLTKVENDAKEQSHRAEQSMRNLDSDLSGRLKNVTLELGDMRKEVQQRQESQGLTLARIATAMEHGITRNELNGLHHRVTDVAKQVAEVRGQLDGVKTLAENINDYLRENKP